jgi:hypothetical protein
MELHPPAALSPRKKANGFRWIEGCVYFTSSLNVTEKEENLLLVVQLCKIFPEFYRSDTLKRPQTFLSMKIHISSHAIFPLF